MYPLMRRRMMMMEAGGSPTPPTPVLPYDAEIEYLEAPQSGSYIQRINTGVIPTIDTKVEILFSVKSKNGNGYFGARKDPYRFCCTTFSNQNQFAFAMTNNTWPSNRETTVLNSQYLCVAYNGNYSINGVDYTSPSLNSFNIDDYFYLFANKNSSNVFVTNARSSTRLYYCKIWENGTLIRDFIPVRVDTIGCLYDRVNGQLYYHEGGGTLTCGQDKS